MTKEFNKLADYYAWKLFSEFGFDTCKYDERQIILTKVLNELNNTHTK